MEYDESDFLTDAIDLEIKRFFRTGSREIYPDGAVQSDVDYVVLNQDDIDFVALGFTLEGETGSYDFESFRSFRRGEVNLIVVDSLMAFRKWRVATAAAKQLRLKRRDDRVRLFQGVLYDNWY